MNLWCKSVTPKVSIIMPSFNSCVHIEQAVKSVLNQTFHDIELLVVDGGSTDGTIALIKKLSFYDDRVRYVNNINDAGPAHARHVGIQQCAGEYVAFLDADDYWLPEKIEKQLRFMQQNDVKFSYTGYRSVDEHGNNLSCPILMRDSYNLKQALTYRGIGILTVMLERSLLTEDVTKSSTRFAEDYLWWLLILKKRYVAKHLDVDAARYRNSNNSRSNNRFGHQLSLWHIYRKHVGLSFAVAFSYYSIYVVNTIFTKLKVSICNVVSRRASE